MINQSPRRGHENKWHVGLQFGNVGGARGATVHDLGDHGIFMFLTPIERRVVAAVAVGVRGGDHLCLMMDLHG